MDISSLETVLCAATRKFAKDITDVWEEIGTAESEREAIMTSLTDDIGSRLSTTLREAQQYKEQLTQTIARDIDLMRRLEMELLVPPFELMHSLTLREVADVLTNQLECLTKEKELRHLAEIDVARNLLIELDRQPQTVVEQAVFDRNLAVSSANVIACRQQLEHEMESNRAEICELCVRLNDLFDLLEISKEERSTQFRLIGPMTHKSATLDQLRHVLDDYNQLKSQRLAKLLVNQRRELTELWQLCDFTTERQQQQCPAFFADEVSETALTELKMCIDHMRLYYADTRRIADSVARRQEIWEQLLELQRRSFDPERLSNRGGCLLKDEKERKRLTVELNKLDHEIGQDIRQFQENSGEMFLCGGMTFEAMCSEQWTEYKQIKAVDKENRLKKKAADLKNELRFGSKPAVVGRKQGGGFASFKPGDINKNKGCALGLRASQQNLYSGPSSSAGCVVMERDTPTVVSSLSSGSSSCSNVPSDVSN